MTNKENSAFHDLDDETRKTKIQYKMKTIIGSNESVQWVHENL